MKKGVMAPVLTHCGYGDIHYRRVIVSRRNHRKMYHRLRKQAYRTNTATRMPGFGCYLEEEAHLRRIGYTAYLEARQTAR